MSRYIVGLSGGIGSGKSTVSQLFAEHNIDIIDADVIARDVVKTKSKALTAITQYFGNDILNQDGQLNRGRLRSLVFSNNQHRSWLNALLHPLIRQELEAKIAKSKSIYCLLVAPLLVENQLDKLVDRVLIVDITESIQLERTLQRDNSNETEIKAIIASQIDRKQRVLAADDIINNDSTDLSVLQKNIAILHKKYQRLSHTANNNDLSNEGMT
jgi:dephospho-CoA kinase